MPLDPRIALAAQVPQVQTPDFGQIMLTAAQLQAAQEQSQMRALQSAQMLADMQEYADLRKPGGYLSQLRDLYGPGGGTAPTAPTAVAPGGLAGLAQTSQRAAALAPTPGPPVAGQAALPMNTMIRVDPGEQAQVPPQMRDLQAGVQGAIQASGGIPGFLGRLNAAQNMPQSVGITRVEPGQPTPFEARQAEMTAQGFPPAQIPPQAAQAPQGIQQTQWTGQPPPLPGQPQPGPEPQAMVGITQAPESIQPTQGPAQSQVEAATPARPMAGLSPAEKAERRTQLLEQIMVQSPRLGPGLVKPFLEIDKMATESRKMQAELQGKVFDATAQVMNSVLELPEAQRADAYQEGLNILSRTFGPQATAQLSPQYAPLQTQMYAINARDAKTRIEQQIAMGNQEIAAQNAATERLKTRLEMAKLPLEERRVVTGETEARIKGGQLEQEKRQKDIEQAARLGGVTVQQTATGEYITVPNVPGAQPGPLVPGRTATSAPLTNPQTGQPYTSMEAQKYRVGAEREAKAQFEQIAKPYREITQSMNAIKASAQNPDAAGDMSLLYAYIKMLDPTTGVRNEETRTAASAGGLAGQIQYWQNWIGKGGTMPDNIRAQFVRRTNILYDAYQKQYQQDASEHARIAKEQGLDPSHVVTDIRATARTAPSQAKEVITRENFQKLLAADAQRAPAENRKPRTAAELRQKLIDGGYQVQ